MPCRQVVTHLDKRLALCQSLISTMLISAGLAGRGRNHVRFMRRAEMRMEENMDLQIRTLSAERGYGCKQQASPQASPRAVSGHDSRSGGRLNSMPSRTSHPSPESFDPPPKSC